jgi:hypothetical protein
MVRLPRSSARRTALPLSRRPSTNHSYRLHSLHFFRGGQGALTLLGIASRRSRTLRRAS